MKRIVAFLMLMVMLLCVFTGCGGQNQPAGQAQTETAVAAETQTETEEAAEPAETQAVTEGQTETGEQAETEAVDTEEVEPEAAIDENGTYTSREDVALYLYTYGHLPENYLTKKEAQALGWDNKKGNLQDVAPGMSIGGDRFGNYEGLLPEADGRKYFECDIDYEGGYRGAERIIFSNDGLIFYTEDHYKTFEQLYGE